MTLPSPTTEGIPLGARRIGILAALLLGVAVAGAGLGLGMDAAVGAFAGGVVALVNFWLLSRFVVSVTGEGDEVHWGVLLSRLMFKLGFLGVCLWVMLVPLALNVLGVIIGLSVVVMAATLAQALGLAS
ncbi:MAG: hypothetical protein GY898_12215 [Proteobacteria bacterium]|nr:hypothetical protein [Pseudomonadota bacterium]